MESVEDLEGCGDARGKLTKPIIQMPGGRGLSAPPFPHLPAAGRPVSGEGRQFRGFRASRRTPGRFVQENGPASPCVRVRRNGDWEPSPGRVARGFFRQISRRDEILALLDLRGDDFVT